MNLRSIQKGIFDIVRSQDQSNSDLIISDDKLNSNERLRAYKRSSYLKPYSCLSDDFQVTKAILGEKQFDEIIASYITDFPADTHFINECGRNFPSFLAKSSQAKCIPFLKDLACLEWLRVESFYDFFNYRTNYVSEKIKKNPSVKTITSNWPLHLIWDEEKAYDKNLTKVFVWTTEDRSVHVKAWRTDEEKVLTALLSSSSLEQAIENLLLAIESEKLTEILTRKLSFWINVGLLDVEVDARGLC